MKNVEGKIRGLKAKQQHALEKLYARKVASRQVVSMPLGKRMAEIATELFRAVAVLIDRKGSIVHVILGDTNTRLYLPDIGRSRAGAGRLRGLRLVVALPQKASVRRPLHLPQDLITDLLRLRLDAVMAFAAAPDGQALATSLLHILPSSDAQHARLDYPSLHDVQLDFDGFIADLEAELSQKADTRVVADKVEGERDRAMLVCAYTVPKHVAQASMTELKELAKTAGVSVADVVFQRRSKLDPKTIVGKGKLEEICLQALHQGADLLIFDRDLSPSQLNAITDLTDLRVLDRTMLILDIFARRATTRGGRMQVELAQTRYSLPRLSKKQSGMSRLVGGIGGQGPGETKLEIDRRRAKDKIAKLERQITKFGKERQLNRKRRNNRSVPTIAIVGYTNAGKSTLLNALTGASAYAKDELFATLDPTSRRLRFPTEREVILIDTVGFIRDLPKSLVNAFRATLEELAEADLLLHVVDIADPRKSEHIQSVHKILDDLGLKESPRLLVFNKADLSDPETAAAEAELFGAHAVSAVNKDGFAEILNRASQILWEQSVTTDHAPWAPESRADETRTPLPATSETVPSAADASAYADDADGTAHETASALLVAHVGDAVAPDVPDEDAA